MSGCSIAFLVNLMFHTLDKFDRPIFGGVYTGGGLIFGMLIGFIFGAYIWGTYIWGGLISRILWYLKINSIMLPLNKSNFDSVTDLGVAITGVHDPSFSADEKLV